VEDFDPMSAALAEADRQADQANARSSSGDRYEPGSLSTAATSTEKKPENNGMSQPGQAPAPKRARDGQTFAQQSVLTRKAFEFQYQDRAEEEWIKQHEAELDKNRQLYGVDEPLAGAKPVSTA